VRKHAKARGPRIRGRLIKIDPDGQWIYTRDGTRVPDEEYPILGSASGSVTRDGETWDVELLYLKSDVGEELTCSAGGYYAGRAVQKLIIAAHEAPSYVETVNRLRSTRQTARVTRQSSGKHIGALRGPVFMSRHRRPR
jgi:hypothetical protein